MALKKSGFGVALVALVTLKPVALKF